MNSPTGIVAPPTLAGVHLKTSPNATRIVVREIKSLRPIASGGVREHKAWWGEIALDHPDWMVPTKKLKHQISLEYQHLRDGQHDLVEDILAGPGPYALAVWKPITLTYVADGQRNSGWMPWPLAVDVVGPPDGLQASKFETVIKVERTGEPLPIVSKNLSELDAGEPVDEAWILTGGQRFKLPAPPNGSLIYLRYYPVLEVFEVEQVERDYTRPLVEPRSLRWTEI